MGEVVWYKIVKGYGARLSVILIVKELSITNIISKIFESHKSH